ncbi:MAG TPA: IS200/IS605 family transposase [Spirochaetia bacterium]|nr:IS200/IS605 family transposase [Spirochaetia bacterium]
MPVNKGRGYVYYLRYHIVFCVKYRHAIIRGAVESGLKEMLGNLAKEHGFGIVALEVMPDHVHLLIDCAPRHYIPNIAKTVKGNTARFLFKEYPPLKKRIWGGHLWNPSYFVATVGENTEETVRKYIESQKMRGESKRW